jgi:N-acetyl-gamma-glutamyl-phosphate reductase
VQITAATCSACDHRSIAEVHPSLVGRLSIPVGNPEPELLAQQCDAVLACGFPESSTQILAGLLAAGCRVVDLSPLYRLSTPALYRRWFGETHPDPGRLGVAPYGLPEFFEDSIRHAPLVSNPGCCAASAILPLAPLLKEGLINPKDIIVDSKCGISGLGSIPRPSNLFGACHDNLTAHLVGSHRHQPEITDVLRRVTGVEVTLAFTAHLVPVTRGVFSTIYVRPTNSVTANQIRECLLAFYAKSPFVRVIGHLPAVQYVRDTNCLDLSIRENDGWIVLLSALDTLGKGSAGAAIQNLNCMFGMQPTAGLLA